MGVIVRVDSEKLRKCVEEDWLSIMKEVMNFNPLIYASGLRTVLFKWFIKYDVLVYGLFDYERAVLGYVVRPLTATKYYGYFSLLARAVRSVCGNDVFLSDEVEEEEMIKQIKSMLRGGAVILPDGSVVRVRTLKPEHLDRTLLLTALRLVVPKPLESINRNLVASLKTAGIVEIYSEGGRRWVAVRREYVGELIRVARRKVLRELLRLTKIMMNHRMALYRRKFLVRIVQRFLRLWLGLPVIVYADLVTEALDIIERWWDNPMKSDVLIKDLAKKVEEELNKIED